MNFPAEELRFTRDHLWVRQDDARVVVGLTAFAQNQLGEIVFLELPAVGEELKRGNRVGAIESTKTVSDLLAPISGKVVEVNQALTEAPDTINRDPYRQGWIAVIEASDPKELADLLGARAYAAMVEQPG